MRNYKTQMEAAKKGIVTPEMETVAKKENMDVNELMALVAAGQVAIPANVNHTALSAEGIGKGLKTKINVNLGISGDAKNYDIEMQKVDMAIKFGAEAIMDLSNYGKTNTFRKELVAKSPAMIGTVPMYDAIGYLDKDLLEISAQDFLKVVKAHAEEGVDFMTIHAGINRRAIEAFRREGRKMNIVSRGGSLLFAWMMMTGNENPFFEYYDEVLEILREYDVTWRRTPSGMSCRRFRRRSDLRAYRAWQPHKESVGKGRSGNGRRPGSYGNERDRRKYDNGKEDMPRCTFLCTWTSGNRHRTWL